MRSLDSVGSYLRTYSEIIVGHWIILVSVGSYLRTYSEIIVDIHRTTSTFRLQI